MLERAQPDCPASTFPCQKFHALQRPRLRRPLPTQRRKADIPQCCWRPSRKSFFSWKSNISRGTFRRLSTRKPRRLSIRRSNERSNAEPKPRPSFADLYPTQKAVVERDG